MILISTLDLRLNIYIESRGLTGEFKINDSETDNSII